ncbi:ribosomal protein, large P2 [Chiua virens]|nr:ribosomal protein, large P2 [Chiua virens]
MRHLAAYLLLQIGGNASPSADDVKNVLGAVGIEADDDRLEKLIAELDGKDMNALIVEGSARLSSVPSGGAVAAAPVTAGGGGGGAAPAAAAEEKKEEKKEEKASGFLLDRTKTLTCARRRSPTTIWALSLSGGILD